jgi:hypothetical protein
MSAIPNTDLEAIGQAVSTERGRKERENIGGKGHQIRICTRKLRWRRESLRAASRRIDLPGRVLLIRVR